MHANCAQSKHALSIVAWVSSDRCASHSVETCTMQPSSQLNRMPRQDMAWKTSLGQCQDSTSCYLLCHVQSDAHFPCKSAALNEHPNIYFKRCLSSCYRKAVQEQGHIPGPGRRPA